MGESEAKDLEVFDARLLQLVPFVSYVILHPFVSVAWILPQAHKAQPSPIQS